MISMQFIPVTGWEELSFTQDTFVVPVVSTGNVGQLAVDVFLSSGTTQTDVAIEKVGFLDTDLVEPAVGYEVFGPGQPPRICLNLELYRFADAKVTLLQQRAPVLPGKGRAFSKGIVEWAREAGFKDILVLTGADAAEGLDPSPLGRRSIKRFRAGAATAHGKEGPKPCDLEKALESAGIDALDFGNAGRGLGFVNSVSDTILDGPAGPDPSYQILHSAGESEGELGAEVSRTCESPLVNTTATK